MDHEVVKGKSRAQEVRENLGYPFIDVDGHLIEYGPVFVDFLREVGGERALKLFRENAENFVKEKSWYTPLDYRMKHRISRPPFWARPSKNSLDRATALIPELRRRRLDEFGIDFSIIFPTLGLTWVEEANDELRPLLCRAYNTMVAEMFKGHQDRMTPVAIIPTVTPDEAIAELDYAVERLGLKSIMICTQVRRTVPAAENAPPEIRRHAYWCDPLAIDSIYDYDPLWARCVHHKVAVTGHNLIFGWGSRRSVSNFMFNHMGHFAQGGHTFSKALFLGGVTKRFPTLNFAFMEGGAAWACEMYNGLVGRWKRRSREAMENYDPRLLDGELVDRMMAEYGGEVLNKRRADTSGVYIGFGDNELHSVRQQDLDMLDDFGATGVARAQDIQNHMKQFYFGCEADDPMVPVAMEGKYLAYGAKLKPVFGSDQGHWDVVNMLKVVTECYELIEDGLTDEAGLREFVFSNPAMLHASMNPDFFTGTVVESDVKKLLAAEKAKGTAAAE